MDVTALKAPAGRALGLLLLSMLLTWLGMAAKASEVLPLYPVAAVLFGLLVRFPALARAPYWLVIFAGLVLAELAAGVSVERALWFNACLLVQVLTACALLTLRPLSGLYEPKNAVQLFVVATFSVALGATLATPYSLHGDYASAGSAWLDWFSEQFASMMLITPMLICLPGRWRNYGVVWRDAPPLLALVLMVWVARTVEGPGSIAFVVPALLWCAMHYRVFTVTCIVFVVGSAEIISASESFVLSQPLTLTDPLCSVRLGVAMMVLSPLLVVTATYANQQLLAQIRHRANHDFLTSALTRRAFTQQAKRVLNERRETPQSLALLIMDLDHFKAINDTYGHSAGDQVLREFAQVVRNELREMDVFGRLGGEEFALLLPSVSHNQALQIAERLRAAVEMHEFRFKGMTALSAKVSVGLSWLDPQQPNVPLQTLLDQADEALYQAKAQGRNKVCTFVVQELPVEKLKLSIY